MKTDREHIKYPDTLSVIRNRKSVKNFTGEPVTQTDLNILFGHPTGDDKPKEKFNLKKIHRERW